nr:hypothetical protein [Tanacetum cinerariifolium]
MILSGADNRPPMLDKDLYDSWKSRMKLYMQNIEHGRMILESVEHGPLIWPTIEENGVNRTKKYAEFKFVTDVKLVKDLHTTNFDPLYVYLKQHELHANEVRLMHEHEFPEWSKFMTDVKLVRDMHKTNVDQLHAYLGQHEFLVNEYASQAQSSTPLSITYPSNDFQSSVYHNVYNPSSFIPQVEYAPSVHQQSNFSQPDTGFVPVFQKGKQRVIVCYNCKGEGHMSKQYTKPKRKRDEAWFKDKTELSAEQVFWSQNSMNSKELNLSTRPTIVESKKEPLLQPSLRAVKQHYVEKNRFQDKMKDVLKENNRLLEQAISTDIVNTVVNASVNYACKTVNECERYVTIETELQRDFIKNESYDKLFKQYTTIEKHCISLEDTIIMKLKERIKSLSGSLKEEKIKRELDEIETINIELDHRVTKLVTENEHLKQTHKQLYDSIKSSRVRSKEQSLKDTLNKLKGKFVVNKAATLHPIGPELLRIDVAPLAPKLLNNRTTHYDYLKHTQEETATLKEIVKNERLLNPLNTSLD